MSSGYDVIGGGCREHRAGARETRSITETCHDDVSRPMRRRLLGLRR